jgi:hypothetical protein
VYTEGEVIFDETRRGTTRMRIVLGYDPPAGRLGALVAHLFGKDPEQQLEEDLERFADVVEGARRRTSRAPYDEREGARSFARPLRDGRRRAGFREDFAGRGEAREDYYAPEEDVRRRDDRDVVRSRAGADEEDDERRRERRARKRFEEALREARHSQLEGQRRYREERALDEQRRYGGRREHEWDDSRASDERRFASAEEDARRRAPDESWDNGRRMSEPEDRRSEDDRHRPSFRHPMTPREWEREQEQRQPDSDYSREAFRRGIDKLMDEPPSKRWRRWD